MMSAHGCVCAGVCVCVCVCVSVSVCVCDGCAHLYLLQILLGLWMVLNLVKMALPSFFLLEI